ncbi:nucleotidyltransferase domain-containing protein [Ignavibacteria bacterium 4148-Me]|uniref:type VII toxin-antitoxin system MntA family adenylyltransferase antitoxin n=1 Tax=Rosettibacter primus TaxID=3111523 RepID=UPI00336C0327
MDYNFISEIIKENNNISFAYLFGSRANNNIRLGSDLDIAVYFENEPSLDEIGKLSSELEILTSCEIDLIKLNNLYDTNPELAYNIIKDGILIFHRNINIANEFKKNAILRYLDFKPLRDKFHNLFLERLSKNKFAL